ncbi:MAG: ATP-binding protein [Nitrososphaerales archaeon]
MAQPYRIGAQLAPGDPFWILVREAMHQRARELAVVFVPLESDLTPLTPEERVDILDELLASDLDALIVHDIDQALAHLILDAGVPLISAVELHFTHPRATSPSSLYEVAALGARHLAERLSYRGLVLLAGGLCEGFDRGESRLQACRDTLQPYGEISTIELPSPWQYKPAYTALEQGLRGRTTRFDGIFGLSDPLALAARDAARAAGLAPDETVVVGVNGDPLALAAIIGGTMTATVETPAVELGRQVVDFACKAAAGEALPPHFSYKPRLVTKENVTAVAAEQLVSSARLPDRLVGYSRDQEAERLRQLETSLAIGDKVGSILDRQQLLHEIAEIIRANYSYDTVQVYMWHEDDQVLELEAPASGGAQPYRLPLSEAGVLGETLLRNQPTFIPDAQRSHQYPLDAATPGCRARVVLPIRFGQQVLGLLGLQSTHSAQHSRLDLVGLQVLADQLGLAMRNAELYGEAIMAQARATQASELKSRLLANVSHELRAPLNVIQGYSQTALATPNPYGVDLPPELLRDLGHVYRSSEHLGRIINDLLDLARAEINDLDVFPEVIAPNALLADVFQVMSGSLPGREGVEWRLELPESLPRVRVDPLRMRQVLYNLMSNAHKFTTQGHITLGALATVAYLHLWVEDTGQGIPLAQQQHIFRAFITSERPRRAPEGLGLGLRITHELVKLHDGIITFTSLPGAGSTFHVYLPLPDPEVRTGAPFEGPLSTLPAEADLPSHATELTRQTVTYLRQNYADETLSRSQVASHVATSESYLSRVFRRDLGIGPWEYLTRFRIEQAKTLLRVSALTVTEVALRVGYSDSGYFSRVFHQETGRSPVNFRREIR